jgi:hypothetical protein
MQSYTAAIDLDDTNGEFYMKRAAAYLKTEHFGGEPDLVFML